MDFAEFHTFFLTAHRPLILRSEMESGFASRCRVANPASLSACRSPAQHGAILLMAHLKVRLPIDACESGSSVPPQ